jgi:hypothetical protein
MDQELRTARTAEHEVRVAAGAAACQDAKVASSLASAEVALEVPAGAPAVPAGFSGAGLGASAAGVVAGVATGAAVSGAAAGGGGATTVLPVAGGVAAAGAAVVATGALGEGDDEGGPPDGSSEPRVYELSFGPSPGVDFGVCNSPPSSNPVCCLRVTAGSDGHFDTLQPGNGFRVMGDSTGTSFTGTLSCVNVAISGPFNASGSLDGYQGDWSLGSQRGVLTVTRVP